MNVNKDVSKVVISAVPKEQQALFGQKKRSGVISAANADFNKSAIQKRREQAGKQAAKILMDAYAQSEQTDAGVKSMHDRIRELTDTVSTDKKLLADGEKRLKDLTEEYGIDPDSKEQQDLDFYDELTNRLKQNGIHPNFAKHDRFSQMVIDSGFATEEEVARFNEIEKKGLTDYQKSALEVRDVNRELAKEIADSEAGIKSLARGISEISIERMKNKVGAKASDQVEELMDAVSKEIIAMIQAEAKSNVDEKMAEEIEKGKEYKEIKEEREERLEEQREKRKEEEELLEEALSDITIISGSMDDTDQIQANVNSKIDSMLSKAKLLPEDIKGTNVDELL